MNDRNEGTRDWNHRNEGTNRRNEGTRERETLWTRPNRVLGPGNEYPSCVDMAGTSDPFSRCVIVRD